MALCDQPCSCKDQQTGTLHPLHAAYLLAVFSTGTTRAGVFSAQITRGKMIMESWPGKSLNRARDRDIEAFTERAPGYDEGWLGRLHHQIADRTVDLALTCRPAPRRILDVGCGTGYLLGRLADRAPQAEALAGIDAAPAMIRAARDAAVDDRLGFVVGTAEHLPWPAESFDLVVSTTSFDHWADQQTGLAQCARVLAPGGCLVLTDLFSVLLLPTLLAGRRGKARTRRRATRLVTAAGLHSAQWHRLYAVIIQAVTATK
jgi:ubiquinone/menaquinone biosynthesis C-methylase UbiE